MIRFFTNERYVLFFILINTAAMIIFDFYDEQEMVYFWIDYGCVVYFSIEGGLKIYHRLKNGQWASSWDIFDVIIIFVCLPVLFDPFLDIPDFSMVTLLRLGRLFRLFRYVRFIPNSGQLAKGILRAIKASVGVILGLGLLNLIYALIAAYLFKVSTPEYFGTPQDAIYSMFKIFTIEGWYEIPENMIASGAFNLTEQWGIRLFFMLAVSSGGILGLSLANAIFVDEMVSDNTQSLENKVDILLTEIHSLRQDIEKLK